MGSGSGDDNDDDIASSNMNADTWALYLFVKCLLMVYYILRIYSHQPCMLIRFECMYDYSICIFIDKVLLRHRILMKFNCLSLY